MFYNMFYINLLYIIYYLKIIISNNLFNTYYVDIFSEYQNLFLTLVRNKTQIR